MQAISNRPENLRSSLPHRPAPYALKASGPTGANNAAGCGGLTGVTPLTLYRDWIVQNRSQLGYRAIEFKRHLI